MWFYVFIIIIVIIVIYAFILYNSFVKLNNKNPKHAPIKMLPNIVTYFIPNIIDITVKQVIIIVVTLVESPSIPSVKLTAFVVASITKIANGM